MDTFFRDIYAPIIFKWLSFQKDQHEGITVSTIYNNEMYQTIYFYAHDYTGIMTLWSKGFVEEAIKRNETQEYVFYLHYAFHNIPHFMKMYREFYHSLIKHSKERLFKAGIVCSGGFTATIFSQMVNASLSLSDVSITTIPLAYYQLKEKSDLDAYYLAPQIAHKHCQLENSTHSFYTIDPEIYGAKDTYAFIKELKKDLL